MKTRKKGILFFAVVAGIMLSSAITLAVNPAQWFGDPSLDDGLQIPTAEELDAFDPDVAHIYELLGRAQRLPRKEIAIKRNLFR